MSPKTNAEPAYEKLKSLFAPAPRKPNTELPTPERKTKKPSANWSPRPQTMVLSLMARRLVENSHANLITLRNESLRFAKFGVAIVMNRGQRFSFFHAIADAFVKFEADAVIDLVFLFLAATAERGQRDSKLLAVCSGDESASGTYYLEMQPRRGQAFRLVNDAFIAALQANPLSEFFECMAGGNHGIGKAAAFFHALGDFIRMPGHAPQRLIHIGNQGHDFFSHALARFDHDFGKPNRIFLLLHERPGARFHIQDQRVNALGKLLAHDGRTNQADILDRRSNIAQRVNHLVGGSDLRSLPD